MKKIGFIGVGIMGKSMVRNLMKKGFDVQIYTRTKSKVEDVISEGAKWTESVETCCKGAEAVISIVGFPKDVEEVYLGEKGILASAAPGTYIIDMTTSSPGLAETIYEEAKKKGLYSLDAPVTGGDSGAKAGTLSILVGGDKEAFDACYDVFAAMGTTITYMGSAGKGQHTKAVNQIAVAINLAGATEAYHYCKKCGLDPKSVLAAIGGGAAASFQLSNVAAKALDDDFAPGFFLKYLLKDNNIALKEAEDGHFELPILNHVVDEIHSLCDEGYGDLGTQGLSKYYK